VSGFSNRFYCLDGAQFHVLFEGSGTQNLQHLTAKEFKSDGAGVDLKETKLLAGWPCDLDTDDIQGDGRFVFPFIDD
jgi:hypothetical protein